jgi:F0F1-type ATP synthase membrane subunit b/b'
MHAVQPTDKPGLLELLNQIQSHYGLIVLILVLLLGFGCFLFWRWVWRVWTGAMKSKDEEIRRGLEEIRRISAERDKYEALALERLKCLETLLLRTSINELAVAIEHDGSEKSQRGG